MGLMTKSIHVRSIIIFRLICLLKEVSVNDNTWKERIESCGDRGKVPELLSTHDSCNTEANVAEATLDICSEKPFQNTSNALRATF